MGASGTLTDLTTALIRSRTTIIDGIVTSAPKLLATDGNNTEYVCDVNVGVMTADGRVNQTQLDLIGVPGGYEFQLPDTISYGTILRNVPIAANNQSLLYAAIGNPVELTRTSTGAWQVSGFSIQMPGTQTRYPVDLKTMTIGTVINATISGRMLTLGEIGEYGGGFGVCPLGASGLFVGGVLKEVG